jgi:hypothetical protein
VTTVAFVEGSLLNRIGAFAFCNCPELRGICGRHPWALIRYVYGPGWSDNWTGSRLARNSASIASFCGHSLFPRKVRISPANVSPPVALSVNWCSKRVQGHFFEVWVSVCLLFLGSLHFHAA